MTALAAAKSVGAPFSNAEEIVRVRYNFADDGGATGAYTIATAVGEILVTDMWAVVKTACVGANNTLSIGDTGSATAIVNALAIATYGASGYVVKKENTFTASGTADTNALPRRLSDGQVLSMSLGGAALTAGVIEFCFKVAKA